VIKGDSSVLQVKPACSNERYSEFLIPIFSNLHFKMPV